MKSVFRLKKNYQYNYVFKHAKSVSDQNFVLLFCTSRGQSKIGFSVSKKYGKAVKRNRLRRQLKAAASIVILSVQKGYNFIIIPRKNQPYKFDTILASLKYLFAKAGVVEKGQF